MTPITSPPPKNEAMMRQLPMPVQINTGRANEGTQAQLVSATDPGMVPMKQLLNENIPPSANMAMTPLEASAVDRLADGVGQVTQCRRSGVAIGHLQGTAGFARGHVMDPDFAAHLLRVREEEERTRRQRDVQDVHARAAKDLLGDDDRESHRDGDHPQRAHPPA